MVARVEAVTTGPWQSFVEGRDHFEGDDFIRTGASTTRLLDMYVTLYEGVRAVPAPAADLDFMAAAREDTPR